MRKVNLWSSGGGVQSTAIAALIIQGKLEKPDLAVISDTEYERSSTWKYLDNYVQPALNSVGVKLYRVVKSDFATVGLYSLKEQKILIPAYTTKKGGKVGKLPTYCSQEWKGRVVRRWADKQRPKSMFSMWMGFTLDEADRMTFQQGKWEHRYPLIQLGMHRSDCYRVINEMGWPEPPRSACYMCPNMHDSEWKWQKEKTPKDHALAIKFQKQIQKKDPDLWLHQEAVDIDKLKLNQQKDFFTGAGCNSGMCFI